MLSRFILREVWFFSFLSPVTPASRTSYLRSNWCHANLVVLSTMWTLCPLELHFGMGPSDFHGTLSSDYFMEVQQFAPEHLPSQKEGLVFFQHSFSSSQWYWWRIGGAIEQWFRWVFKSERFEFFFSLKVPINNVTTIVQQERNQHGCSDLEHQLFEQKMKLSKSFQKYHHRIMLWEEVFGTP